MSYVTKLEVKKYLGVNFTESMDTFVDTVIAGCEKYIERECGDSKFGVRIFEERDALKGVTRRFDGTGGKRLYCGDLFSVDSIEVDGEAYTVDSDVYLYPLNNEDIAYEYIEMSQPETRINSNSRRISDNPYVFECGQANVEITGDWFYSEVPPDDIKLAMLKLVGGVLKENISDSDVRETKSETLGDYQISYTDIKNIAHSLKVDDILKNYKRKSPAQSAGAIQVS